jgi:hypothetical protein
MITACVITSKPALMISAKQSDLVFALEQILGTTESFCINRQFTVMNCRPKRGK